jgi:short-subunit dehydrogenase
MAKGTGFAVVTGASTGIGYFLANECAKHGYDLLIAADETKINRSAETLRTRGVEVKALKADLATLEGVDKLCAAAAGRPIDLLFANAGRGLGKDFLDQEFDDVKHLIDTNITVTLYLIQKVGREMRDRREGRILITGSIAGFTPGSYQAAYNGSKAFLDSFSFAIRTELEGSGVSVTCLMPGATETEFFARADMLDTKIGSGKKDDPAEVARVGFDALMRGDGDIVSGWHNKLQTVLANVMPSGILSRRHAEEAAPGTARN